MRSPAPKVSESTRVWIAPSGTSARDCSTPAPKYRLHTKLASRGIQADAGARAESQAIGPAQVAQRRCGRKTRAQRRRRLGAGRVAQDETLQVLFRPREVRKGFRFPHQLDDVQ